MQNSTIIFQPTAEELIKFFSMSAQDNTTSVKLTVEITKRSQLTLKEAAKYISRSQVTLRDYIKKGLIPYTKNGLKIQFKIEDLDQFLQDGGNC